jgi:hypothetical protein
MANFFLERALLYETTGIKAKQLRFSERFRSIINRFEIHKEI